MSGLAPNPDKSHLFTCGVARNVKLQMLSILGYKEGSLPVRYLGVPLVSTRLKKADCNALVEKIIARFNFELSELISKRNILVRAPIKAKFYLDTLLCTLIAESRS